MKKIGVSVATVVLGAVFLLAPSDKAEAATSTVDLPNPIVTYDTYAEAKTALGFAPLYMPPLAGYELYYISTIGGDLADISYRKIGGKEEFRVRTTHAKDGTKENISGLYGVQWQNRSMCGINVGITKVGANSFAAYWSSGKYLFSVQSEGLSYPDFLRLLENGLVDTSCHYYVD